jgi:hypothetical protein
MLTNEQLRELLTDLKQGELNHRFRLSEDLTRCAGQITQIERMEIESSEIVKDDPAGLALMDQASAAIRDNLPTLKGIVQQMKEKIQQSDHLIQQCDDCLNVVDTGNNVLANAQYDQVFSLARRHAGLDV